MVLKYVQSPTFYLAGSGVIVGATSVTLTSFVDIYGNALALSDFGSKGYITLEPDTSNEESASFTSVTVNANGTITLGGISTTIAKSPYTETSGLIRGHSGGSKVVVTDTVAFWNTFANKNNDETVTGKYTFPDTTNRPKLNADTDTAVATELITLGQLSRQAISGASNASTTVKGIVELATQAEVDAKTTTGGTGALLVATPDIQRSTLLSDYVVDTGAADAYVITPVPAISAYATGQIFTFKAAHTNTTASTLNVNGKGVTAIKKRDGATALIAGDITAGQIIQVEYDGTNFQMINAEAFIDGRSSYLTKSVTAAEAINAGSAVSAGYAVAGGLITTDTVAEGSVTTSSNAGTFSFTVGNHTNRILLVTLVSIAGSGTSISAVKYAGSNMTTLAAGVSTTYYSGYIMAPTVGANNVTFTADSATVTYKYTVYSFYNASQSALVSGDHNEYTSTGATSASVAVTPSEPGCVVVGSILGNTVTATGSWKNENALTGNGQSGDTGIVVPATAITVSGTQSSAAIAATAVVIHPLAALTYGAVNSSATAGVYNNFRTTAFLGFALNTVSTGQVLNLATNGIVSGLSLTPLAQYYLGNSNGTIGTSAGSVSRKIGIAIDSSNLLITNVW